MKTSPIVRFHLRELDAKATPAPWHDDSYRVSGPTEDEDKRNGPTILEYKQLCDGTIHDGPLATGARNHLIDMLDDLDTLEAEKKDLEEKLSKIWQRAQILKQDGGDELAKLDTVLSLSAIIRLSELPEVRDVMKVEYKQVEEIITPSGYEQVYGGEVLLGDWYCKLYEESDSQWVEVTISSYMIGRNVQSAGSIIIRPSKPVEA